jgi:hypothetical protein
MELVHKRKPITLVGPLNQFNLVGLILDMFKVSLRMQRQPREAARMLHSRLRDFERRVPTIPQDSHRAPDAPLLAFLRKSILRWNRAPTINIRSLTEDEISANLSSLDVFKGLFDTLDDLDLFCRRRHLEKFLTMVTHNKDQETVLNPTRLYKFEQWAHCLRVRLLVKRASGPSSLRRVWYSVSKPIAESFVGNCNCNSYTRSYSPMPKFLPQW